MSADHNSTTAQPVALVTGGARRVGAGICRSLHDAGFNLVIHCHSSRDEAQALAHALNERRAHSAHVVSAELAGSASVKALAQQTLEPWQRLDALINNASSFFPTPFEEASEAQWQNLMTSNLQAPYFLSQALLPALRQAQGCIINIADIFAERPMPGHSIYSIAKAGNVMMTKALAQELAPEVRVNGIAPGAILWPEAADGSEKVDQSKLDLIPLGTLGGVDAIAETVLFLIKRAPYITGEIIKVDGGRALRQ